jgi:hypothetical protein
MEITSNLTQVIGDILGKFSELGNPNTVSRAVATAVMPEMRKRIHVDGKNSRNSQIGVYSNSYLRLRQKKYNRSADSDVVISLTRQLENSYILGGTETSYNISFSTPLSFDKATWMEEKYGKIWDLTLEESAIVQLVANNETKKIMQ